LTALIVWGSIAALLTAFLTMKVGARMSFGDGFKLILVIGPVKKELKFDGNKSEKSEKSKRAKKKNKKIKNKSGELQSTETESTEPLKEQKEPFLGGFDKKKLIKLGIRSMVGFMKLLRIDIFKFSYTAGGKSADKTALAYGRMCAALGALLPFMDNYLRVKRRHISTDIDFESDKSHYSGVIQVTVVAGAALMFGLWILIELMKCRKKHDGDREGVPPSR